MESAKKRSGRAPKWYLISRVPRAPSGGRRVECLLELVHRLTGQVGLGTRGRELNDLVQVLP
jgi:hypothetical protein